MKRIVLSIIVLLLPLLTFAQDATYGKNPTAGKYYDIRGFKMYCEVYGSGEPILLIHGNGGSIDNFVKQIPFFSKKYKVIIADSRAQGKSIDKKDSLSYDMMADDFAELLTKMNVPSANVIGWSDGGINGLLLAIRHPEKVRKLAITGANTAPDSTAVAPNLITEMVTEFDKLNKKPNKTDAEKNSAKLLKLMIDQPHIKPSDLKKIKSPTLVIGGDHDLIKPTHTVYIFENIPNAMLWIVPNSGHGTLIEHADEFNKKVDDFFNMPQKSKE
ncbi:MAG TPA: alpha/beta hydrolase [Flavobacterium sp.]|nr:alpha/beta hydrolase [Flavobacterium sp.]